MPDFRYEKVKRALLEEVTRNSAPGRRLPPLKDLARQFGVSRNTIQHAVDDLASEQILRKRRGSGIYVADPKSKPLRIGFIYPWTMQQLHGFHWHHELILHVEAETARLGHELIISCNVGKETATEVPEFFLRALLTFDGVFFFNMENNQIIYDTITRGIPSVLLHTVLPVFNAVRVEADGAGGMSQATRHLIELGHRRIAFLTARFRQRGKRHLLFEDREEGWRNAMSEAGLPCDSSLVLQAPPSEWDESCTSEFRRMVSGSDPVTAFVCINDISASYLYKGAHAVGLRIPNDLSVVGCENTPLSDLLHPRITSIQIPQDQIAHFAVNTLIDMIHNGTPEQLVHGFRTNLVIKESTAPPRQSSGRSSSDSPRPLIGLPT